MTLPLRGDEAAALRFLQSREGWIVAARERVAARAGENTPLSAEEVEQLRERAKKYLPNRVEQIASHFLFEYGRVTIRATRTKWGSCSGENNISLSLFLMTLPSHLIDFVIIHELCHTLHHNHSPQFHALVDRCTAGRERELHRELRGHSCG